MRYADWDEFMAEQRRSGLLKKISDFVTAERFRFYPVQGSSTDFEQRPVYPPSQDVFNFTLTPLRDVKVVILGQDPYHGPGQAHGLAFSVKNGVQHPPSLHNILRELVADVGDVLGSYVRPKQRECGDARGNVAYPIGDLTAWTQQGVLLLNTALTVRQADPASHLDIWQPFTDEVVRAVVDSAAVAPHFVLWGKHAKMCFERCVGKLRNIYPTLGQPPHDFQACGDLVNSRRVTATYSPHPSPLSADRGFFGSRPFSRANLALRLNNPGRDCAVDWRLP